MDATAFSLPTVDDIDDGWITEPIRAAMQVPQTGATTRRAASALLRSHYDLDSPTVPGCKAWLLRPLAAQRTLAIDLGLAANVNAVRRAVHGSQVAALIDALGTAGYREALRRTPLPTQGLAPTALADAIEAGGTTDFFGAVGVALLVLDLDAEDPYVRLRMRFAFPPAWWDGQPAGLNADRAELAAAIGSAEHG